MSAEAESKNVVRDKVRDNLTFLYLTIIDHTKDLHEPLPKHISTTSTNKEIEDSRELS